MSGHRQLMREVFGYCAETCPEVEAAFHEAITDIEPLLDALQAGQVIKVLDRLLERVKDVGTLKLRDALTSAVSDKSRLEDELEDSKAEVSRLESRVDSLENEIASLEHQLSQAEAA